MKFDLRDISHLRYLAAAIARRPEEARTILDEWIDFLEARRSDDDSLVRAISELNDDLPEKHPTIESLLSAIKSEAANKSESRPAVAMLKRALLATPEERRKRSLRRETLSSD